MDLLAGAAGAVIGVVGIIYGSVVAVAVGIGVLVAAAGAAVYGAL